MIELENEIRKSPLLPKKEDLDRLDETSKKVKEYSKIFNKRSPRSSTPRAMEDVEPMEKYDDCSSVKKQCANVRKSDLAKITELEKKLEDCKNKPGLYNKIKRSLKKRFRSQKGGKRKKTRRRKNKKTKRNHKTKRNRKATKKRH